MNNDDLTLNELESVISFQAEKTLLLIAFPLKKQE